MNSDLWNIKEALEKQCKVEISPLGEVLLVESKNRDRRNCLGAVKVRNLPQQSVVVKFESVGVSGLLDLKGVNRHCDYVIITENKKDIFVILIELKTGQDSEVPSQLRASECLVDYVFSVLRSFSRINNEKTVHHNKRFVVLARRSLPKQPTGFVGWKSDAPMFLSCPDDEPVLLAQMF